MERVQSPLMAGFFDEFVYNSLPQELSQLIVISRAPLLYRCLYKANILRPTIKDYSIFVNIQQSAQYELLRLHTICVLSPWQETVRLALLVAIMTTDVQFLPNHSYTKNLSQQLRQSCREALLTINPQQKQAMVWALFIGSILSKGLPQRTWFVMEMARLCQGLGLDTCDAFRDLLGRFVFLDWMYEEKLQEIWQEAESLLSVLAMMG